MKALSIKNPWAMLIAHDIKPIENRTWKTSYRGRIYIHCSAKSLIGNIKNMFNEFQWTSLTQEERYMITGHWPNGCIIGEVDVIDCVQGHESIWAEKALDGKKPIWNWVLANPVKYDQPIENVKGKLGLWEYDSEV